MSSASVLRWLGGACLCAGLAALPAHAADNDRFPYLKEDALTKPYAMAHFGFGMGRVMLIDTMIGASYTVPNVIWGRANFRPGWGASTGVNWLADAQAGYPLHLFRFPARVWHRAGPNKGYKVPLPMHVQLVPEVGVETWPRKFYRRSDRDGDYKGRLSRYSVGVQLNLRAQATSRWTDEATTASGPAKGASCTSSWYASTSACSVLQEASTSP